jgi:hypothetical protein
MKMTRLGLILVLSIFLAAACDVKPKPAGVLSKEQYVALLVEVYIAEAKLSQLPVSPDSTMRLYLAHEPDLLRKFSISDTTLQTTYEYFINHPKELEEVFTAVIDTLSLREQRAN